MQIRQSFLPLLVVALVVTTAGCSSLSGGQETTTGDTASNSSGYGVSGDNLDGETIQQAMEQQIADAGSYTLTVNGSLTLERPERSRDIDATVNSQVNLENQRGLRTTQQNYSGASENTTVAVYTDGDTSYQRVIQNGTARYDRQTGSASDSSGIRPIEVDEFGPSYDQLIDGLEWEATGTTQIDGVTATTYSADSVANRSALNIPEGATVERVEASMAIDSNGIVREFSGLQSFSDDSGTTTDDVTQRITNVGTTTVPEPDWLSNADG